MGQSAGMNPGDVILTGLRDFGARWKDLVTAVAVVVLPISAVGLAIVAMLAPDAVGDLLNSTMTPEELEASLASVTTQEWIRFGVAYAIFVVLSGIANTVAFGACLAIEREHVRGNEISYGAGLREAVRRCIPCCGFSFCPVCSPPSVCSSASCPACGCSSCGLPLLSY